MILLKLELKILFEIKHGQERRYKKYIVFVQLRGVHLLLARVIVERKKKKMTEEKEGKRYGGPKLSYQPRSSIPNLPNILAQA